ncbi:MAG: Txe/YoeB family addiction module toxin [Prevotella sp.]|uniref:Txe/YoeB family addiction module toxin n=1 Tax=Prevotella sp. AGR2160 TaxID=1280674 RepID=UPI00048C2893|nr:Txe/YoeB family addiction module toxin [Prevotella sp. AGR2160]MDD5861040.1 Txe/YoeB family addiction module toxin [Prevotella sp.]
MYEIEFSKQAREDLAKMMKSDIQSFRKFQSLLPELREHPYTGTGHPHELRYLNGVWSRKLDKKNRLRYMVNETTVIVFVISAMGHYDDK